MTSVLFIIYFRTPVDDHLPSSASGPLRLAGVGLYKSDSLGIMLPKATGELYISLLPRPHRGRARYCNAHVCLCVCLFVCLCVCVFVCPCFRKNFKV